MAENNNMQDMLRQMSRQLNLSEKELKDATKNGNTKKMAEEILSDPQKAKELLESPQAKAIIEMLRKGK